jgi:hypothetical protein
MSAEVIRRVGVAELGKTIALGFQHLPQVSTRRFAMPRVAVTGARGRGREWLHAAPEAVMVSSAAHATSAVAEIGPGSLRGGLARGWPREPGHALTDTRGDLTARTCGLDV